MEIGAPGRRVGLKQLIVNECVLGGIGTHCVGSGCDDCDLLGCNQTLELQVFLRPACRKDCGLMRYGLEAGASAVRR